MEKRYIKRMTGYNAKEARAFLSGGEGRMVIWFDDYTGEMVKSTDPEDINRTDENTREWRTLSDGHRRPVYRDAYVSRETLDVYFMVCDNCGRVFPADEAVEARDSCGNYIMACPDCLDSDFTRCEECGEWVENSEVYEARDRNGYWQYVCESCIEYSGDYVTCASCGDIVHVDYACYSNRDGEWYCEDCYEEEAGPIHEYHSFSNDQFHGEGPGYVGFELEIDDGSFRYEVAERVLSIVGGEEYAHCEEDGSVDFEIVTQPHEPGLYFAEPKWERMFDYLKNETDYRSHEAGTCGLHVHVSREFFGDDRETQNDNIAKVVTLYDVHEEFFTKLSRRTPGQIDHWCKFGGKKTHEEGKKFSHDRYCAVNTTNRATVEYRMGRGTLVYATAMAWIDLHVTISRNAAKMDIDDYDLHKWVDGIRPETAAYIAEHYGEY